MRVLMFLVDHDTLGQVPQDLLEVALQVAIVQLFEELLLLVELHEV